MRPVCGRALRQILAARANLEAAPDDSHSNLGWDRSARQFSSHPLRGNGPAQVVGLSLSPLLLSLTNGEASELDLGGLSYGDAEDWLDQKLSKAGLKPASSVELPDDVANVGSFDTGGQADRLAALAAWFDLAQDLLSSFAEDNAGIKPGPSSVRCWPHHFDIATYVGLETGDFETARGVGVGMSPDDESYAQPYFYINPWGRIWMPPTCRSLPLRATGIPAVFVGAIATSKEVLSLEDIDADMAAFISGAFAIGRDKLGV